MNRGVKHLVQIKEIRQLDDADIVTLSHLLQIVVQDGASIGFLPPLSEAVAMKYWQQVLEPSTTLWMAMIDDQVVGTVQLIRCQKENGIHRAEIAKLMVHPNIRRKGIARRLMEVVEMRARAENLKLLVLDTRAGDPSNRLYQSLQYCEAGRIPIYARSANGELHESIFYYKIL
ncbi:GNAT family N-acetyltransferase [Hazenella sp. IB182353]|nr:GNAT family N-acetyltransferase [Polycladospora coralii]